MSSLPHPDRVARQLEQQAKLALALAKEYRWAYQILHSGRGSSMGVRPTRRGPIDPDLDPTGDAAANEDKMARRASAQEFVNLAAESSKKLDEATQRLGRAIPLNLLRGRPIFPKYASMMTEEEWNAKYDTKDRREERGEGYGEA